MKTTWGLGKHGVVESENLFNTSFSNMIGLTYMTACTTSNKQVKYMKPYTAPLDILTFNI